jgi:hypothetical protein
MAIKAQEISPGKQTMFPLLFGQNGIFAEIGQKLSRTCCEPAGVHDLRARKVRLSLREPQKITLKLF